MFLYPGVTVIEHRNQIEAAVLSTSTHDTKRTGVMLWGSLICLPSMQLAVPQWLLSKIDHVITLAEKEHLQPNFKLYLDFSTRQSSTVNNLLVG